MGDRANVKVVYEDSVVFLYTHWEGFSLPSTVQNALLKKERWDDGQYLSRIIFQEMIGQDTSSTGFGISSVVGDGDDRVLIVNVDEQSVSVKEKRWTFDEFLKTDATKAWA
jgi:hypothetical protein